MNTPRSSVKQVKVQIPLSKTLRDAVKAHAAKLGFNSVQDFTRVMYATVVHNNAHFSLTDDREALLSPAAEARYRKQLKEHEADREAGTVKSFDNVDDFLADLKQA